MTLLIVVQQLTDVGAAQGMAGALAIPVDWRAYHWQHHHADSADGVLRGAH